MCNWNHCEWMGGTQPRDQLPILAGIFLFFFVCLVMSNCHCCCWRDLKYLSSILNLHHVCFVCRNWRLFAFQPLVLLLSFCVWRVYGFDYPRRAFIVQLIRFCLRREGEEMKIVSFYNSSNKSEILSSAFMKLLLTVGFLYSLNWHVQNMTTHMHFCVLKR